MGNSLPYNANTYLCFMSGVRTGYIIAGNPATIWDYMNVGGSVCYTIEGVTSTEPHSTRNTVRAVSAIACGILIGYTFAKKSIASVKLIQ